MQTAAGSSPARVRVIVSTALLMAALMAGCGCGSGSWGEPGEMASEGVTNSKVLAAEWWPMEGVLVRYPLIIPTSLVVDVSFHIEHVVVLCALRYQSLAVYELASAGCNMSRIHLVNIETDGGWVRDYGPWMVYDANGPNVVDFTYNRVKPPRFWYHDDLVNVQLATVLGLPYTHSGLTLTGGNMMSDGRGRLYFDNELYFENGCVVYPCKDVNERLRAAYGAGQTISFADPSGKYIRHIDTWSKIVSPGTVIVGVPVSHDDPRHAEVENAADRFEANGLRVFRINMSNYPNEAYSNSLLLNGRVYVPVTGRQAEDLAALDVYRAALPTYTVVGVEESPIMPWRQTDSLHCRIRGLPSVGVLATRDPVAI